LETKSDDATEYEFEPFETIFLLRREELLRLVDVSSIALRSLSASARLSEALRHGAEVVETAREIEELALREVESDFPLLHNAATVLLWGALEASFRDFLVRWLVRNPSALRVPELQNVRVKVVEYEGLMGEDRMRYLVGILERELAASLRPGVGRYECLLKPFGISPKITDDERRDLNEMAAIRNVIVHRAGFADRRLLELCPWLGLEEGEAVNVSRDSFDRHMASASEYAAKIIDTVKEVSSSAS
jgi:hypothetical protein